MYSIAPVFVKVFWDSGRDSIEEVSHQLNDRYFFKSGSWAYKTMCTIIDKDDIPGN